jgi:hypothetical protein
MRHANGTEWRRFRRLPIEPSRAPDRDKASIAVGLGAGPRLRQLIVWDTRQTELD